MKQPPFSITNQIIAQIAEIAELTGRISEKTQLNKMPALRRKNRIGRLWHTLILSKWNAIFTWLPVEPLIHDRQQEYYQVINYCNNACESTKFIEFMLDTIAETLKEAIETV